MNLVMLALIIGNTFSNACPVLLTGLGGMISEKSGVVNIGLEGMMTIGALMGATVGYYLGNPWIAFLAGGLAGAVFGLIHAIISVSFAGDQTISGIAINTLGPGLALFLARLFFDGATQTPSIPLAFRIIRAKSQRKKQYKKSLLEAKENENNSVDAKAISKNLSDSTDNFDKEKEYIKDENKESEQNK